MSEQMITLILWLPFAIVAAISAVIFCVAGYRRGLWNALLSLAATLIALPCSVFIARLLAQPVSKTINRALSQAVGSSDDGVWMSTLLHGLVCAAMAMVLYFVLMVVLTALFKYIANTLWGERLQSGSAAIRWGGIAVRLVDAAVYTLLLLLPLYGSIGTILPVATSISRFTDVDDDVQQMLNSVEEHPVAKITSTGPFKTVYGQLAVVPTDNGDIQIVEFAGGISGTVERVDQLTQAIKNGEFSVEMGEEVIAFVRKEVVHQEWFYAVYQEGLKQLAEEEDWNEPLLLEFLELADMDQKTFARNADAILELVQYVLEKDVPLLLRQNPGQEDEILYDTGVVERLGAMINSSEESVALRDFLVKVGVMHICKHDEAKAASLMASYRSRQNTSAEDLVGDAEAILLIWGFNLGDRTLNMYEGLLRLPGFDQEALYRQFVTEDFSYLEREYSHVYSQWVEELQEKYGYNMSLADLLWQELLECSRQPVTMYGKYHQVDD